LFLWLKRKLAKKHQRNILIIIDKAEKIDKESIIIFNYLLEKNTDVMVIYLYSDDEIDTVDSGRLTQTYKDVLD
jgi:hypothetical protein